MEDHGSVYLDDIIIHSSAEDHLKIIEEIFNRREEENLVVNESKRFFGRRNIEHGKISALSDKVKSMTCSKLEERSEMLLGGFIEVSFEMLQIWLNHCNFF